MLTKEDCIKLGNKYYNSTKLVPRAKKWTKKEGYCSRDIIYNLFGSWNNFLSELSIEGDIKISKIEDISIYDKAVIKYIDSSKKIPSLLEFCKLSGLKPTSLKKYCKSYNELLLRNSINPTINTPHNKWSKESLINNIKEFVRLENRIPQSCEIQPAESIYRHNFGSWNKAIKAAGFIPSTNDGYGNRTFAKDGILYRSKAEAYFVDNFLYSKYSYEYERKYDNHNKYYDFYLPELDLYIELDGEIRPQVIDEKIEINKKENKNLLVIKTKDIYNKKDLNEFISV